MGATERVLIVEDELHALAGLAELVSGWGYRTETARDGIEGLEKVAEFIPGIIVTDLKMPRMDGLEFLSRLSEMQLNAAVIVLTARDPQSNEQKTLQAGAAAFFQKPADNNELLDVIRATLPKAWPGVPLPS